MEVWRVHIPKLAYTREWLMRGMIAISALQVASYPSTEAHKTSELVQLALTSLNAGLPNLNSRVATVTDDDTDGGSAVAAYSGLVAIYALAMPSVQHYVSTRLGATSPEQPLEVCGQTFLRFYLGERCLR